MPAKIWYNNAMHNMTDLQMVTFVNGVKKHITKGVTFVNGEKKVLWQTGNFAINSWTLQELQYPNNMETPVGMYATGNRIIYSVGDYITRNNVANISAPYQEACVKNGGVFGWDAKSQTLTNESFISGFVTQRSSRVGSSVYITYVTTLNKVDIDTGDLSVTVGASTVGGVITGGVHGNAGVNGWVSVAPVEGGYRVYTGQTTLANIPATGYSTTTKPAKPCMVVQSENYLLFGYAYQATSGGSVSYGIKRVKLDDGSYTDFESGLGSEVTSIMVDGSNVLYTSGNTLVKKSAAGATTYGTYTSANTPIVLLGRMADYYYCGSTTEQGTSGRYFLNIEIVKRSDMTLRETHATTIKAKTIKSAPYVSNNKYLCFGTWHGIYFGSTSGGGIGSSYNTIPTGTITEVEYRVNRIQGY